MALSWRCLDRTALAVCQASCPHRDYSHCSLDGCPWRCNGCAQARPRDANGYHLDKRRQVKVLCNRVKFLGLPWGWVLPGMGRWIEAATVANLEWMNALGERVDWTWKYDGRFCESTSALPQQFERTVEFAEVMQPLSWMTTEGSGALPRGLKPTRKPPQSCPSRGGRRYA